MSIHDGHRERLKERFRKEGLDNFDELYVLELLLFYCIPRVDTNPIAHKLLDHFGSLTRVLDAKAEELEKVEGVGKNVATFLSLITQVGRFYQVKRSQTGEILRSIDQCGNYLVPYFFGREQETVFLLCLDAKCKVICCKMVGEGSVNSANVPVRRVVEMALAANATTVVLAHNHPSGLAIPSADDIQTTHRIATALDAVEITLADHIVVSRDDYVSMVQSQYFKPQDISNAW
ncbi:MAG: DNA repair protein RadC [Ruminococcaceae bacterium]|nr:DNA repair protein RadC [Oscillospiraceae bacterium]